MSSVAGGIMFLRTCTESVQPHPTSSSPSLVENATSQLPALAACCRPPPVIDSPSGTLSSWSCLWSWCLITATKDNGYKRRAETVIVSVVDRYLAGMESKNQWAFLCRARHAELVDTAQEMHITLMSLKVQSFVIIHWGYFLHGHHECWISKH